MLFQPTYGVIYLGYAHNGKRTMGTMIPSSRQRLRDADDNPRAVAAVYNEAILPLLGQRAYLVSRPDCPVVVMCRFVCALQLSESAAACSPRIVLITDW
jgi:hypothetical protein